jgi:hypothetical protein
MKKTLALIIGSVIVIAFLAVFLASDEGAPVTTPIDTATTTAVVATTTLEKTELDLNEWKQLQDSDTNTNDNASLFVEGSEFFYPKELVAEGICGMRGCHVEFCTIDDNLHNRNCDDEVFELTFFRFMTGFSKEEEFSKRNFTKLDNLTITENLIIFDRPAKKYTHYYGSSDGITTVTEYTLEIDNINAAYHKISLSIDDTHYSNTEEIFNEIIARMQLGPIPEEDQQVLPIPPEFNQDA